MGSLLDRRFLAAQSQTLGRVTTLSDVLVGFVLLGFAICADKTKVCPCSSEEHNRSNIPQFDSCCVGVCVGLPNVADYWAVG